MQYLYETLMVLALAVVVSKVTLWLGMRAKRAKSESQLHDFVGTWAYADPPADVEEFREAKQLLMLDWLEAHPTLTRLDFTAHFDQVVDGYCECEAIDAYLKRREITLERTTGPGRVVPA